MPPAARVRYEAVFVGNFKVQRRAEGKKATPTPSEIKKSRQAAGWRGLSVDLITDPDHPDRQENKEEDEVDLEGARLEGTIVKRIWKLSGLSRLKLKDIWFAEFTDYDTT